MDSAIMAAIMRQDHVTQNEEAWRTYWSHRMAEHDRISNLNGAREEKAIEIAQKMKNARRPCREIEEFTGLSSETIAGL